MQPNIDAQLSSLSISEEEMLACLSPYIISHIPADHPEGRLVRRQRAKNILHMLANSWLKQLSSLSRERVGSKVERNYEAVYQDTVFEGYKTEQRFPPHILNNHILMMNGVGLARAMSLAVERALEIINPQSVCEIGCGNGRHLIHLSTQFPQTQFSGCDLATSAIEGAKNLQTQNSIDLHLAEHPGPITREHMELVRKINFFQADASDMKSVPDNSFDVIFTVHALEQMSDRLDQALHEIKRIAGKYVIFCEPFWDCNDALGNAFLYSNNYFHASVKHLTDLGFKEVVYLDILPKKPTFKYAIFIAKVGD